MAEVLDKKDKIVVDEIVDGICRIVKIENSENDKLLMRMLINLMKMYGVDEDNAHKLMDLLYFVKYFFLPDDVLCGLSVNVRGLSQPAIELLKKAIPCLLPESCFETETLICLNPEGCYEIPPKEKWPCKG